MESYNREQKNLARTRALLHGKSNKPAKCALFLPSLECLCVKEALKLGVIDKNTVLLFIEDNNEYYPKVEKNIKALGFKTVIGFNKSLEDTRFNSIPGIEYAFIDSCRQLTEKVKNWIIYTLWKNISENGLKVAFNFHSKIRFNALLQGVSSKANIPSIYHSNINIHENCRDVQINMINELFDVPHGCKNLLTLDDTIPYGDTATPMYTICMTFKKPIKVNKTEIKQIVNNNIPKSLQCWFLTSGEKAWLTRSMREQDYNNMTPIAKRWFITRFKERFNKI